MPIYSNLPLADYYPKPERFIRKLYAGLKVESVLDVGAGHGGVFDCGYLTDLQMTRREACDIHWIRPMDSAWATRVGVDAERLTSYYDEKSFDLVQCMEVLEHMPNPLKALEQFCEVARKIVVITSADEEHHRGDEQVAIEKINPYQKYVGQPSVDGMRDLGFTVMVDNLTRRQLIAWKLIK